MSGHLIWECQYSLEKNKHHHVDAIISESTKYKFDSKNTAISKDERKVWVVIDMPPENSKTGSYYRISTPVTRYLEGMRKVSKHKKPDDFLFCNQQTTQPFS